MSALKPESRGPVWLAAKAAKRAAFTLVELLIVVGIIAVLIAILLPVLSRARGAAYRTVCLSNIRQLGTGVFMYCHENKGWFPTCAFPDSATAGGDRYMPDDWVHWQANRKLQESAIARYVSDGKDPDKFATLLRCPADSFEGRLPRPGYTPGQGPFMYSYCINEALGRNVPSQSWRTKLVMWRASWKKIMLSESQDQRSLPYLNYVMVAYPSPEWGIVSLVSRRHGSVIFQGNVPGNPWLARGVVVGSKANTFFLDGHAESIEQGFGLDPGQIQNNPLAG